jgi:hypothetical protein
MIIVRITGGLGNQLFQYCFGIYLSKVLKKEVKYDIQTSFNSSSFTSREMGLHMIGINFQTTEKIEIEKFKYYNNGFLYRLERKFVQLFPHTNKKYFVEKHIHHTLDENLVMDNCYYDGYWQSYRYVQLIEDLKISMTPQKTVFKDSYSKIFRKIINEESVGIHIRRGDYISNVHNRKIFSTCSPDYYLESINFMKKKLSDPSFYIFSDDINWVKQQNIFAQFTVIEGNKASEDFFLMSQCKHNIIANSTFSWWAAWLNQNKNKVVIAPKQWYHGKLNEKTADLIPPSWIRM